MMRIEIDSMSGFCFGVVNAISQAESSLAECGEVYSLGDIVHNRLEVQRLGELGLKCIGHNDLESVRGKQVLIRAHGEPPETYVKARELGIGIIDATCPVVAKLQTIVADASASMKERNGQVVILGKRGHAEVVGLTGHADGNVLVVEGKADLEHIDFSRPVFLLSQTTQSLALFGEIKDEIIRRADNPADVQVKDTICRQVSNREEHLRRFAQRFDVVLFVSGKKSSNGRVLYEVCKEANSRCYHIEDSSELDQAWLDGAESVGICGATSTPYWLMEQVAENVAALTKSR